MRLLAKADLRFTDEASSSGRGGSGNENSMSMIRNLGEGYYGVEATTRAISPAVLERMDQAYAEAMAIPDGAIIITDYKYKGSASGGTQSAARDAASRTATR